MSGALLNMTKGDEMKTMSKNCENCEWWKKDCGFWSFNAGWSGQFEDNGHCHLERKRLDKKADDFCSHFQGKEKTDAVQP